MPRRWGAWLAAPLLCAAGGVHAAADMVLSQHTVAPDPVPAGGTATVTVVLRNNGPDAAQGVKLTDVIPPGSTFVSMSATDSGVCTTSAPYECTWAADVPNAGQRTVTLRLVLPTAAVWPNNASVSTTSTDSNNANNSLTRNITAVAAADLQVTASHNAGGGAVAGTPYAYTVNVSNNGPDGLPAGQSPKVTFSVPSGSTITAIPTGAGWACSIAPAGAYPRSSGTITCDRNDALPTGNSFPAITVPAVGNLDGTVSASFGVGSNFQDADLANNTALVNVPFSSGTDMALTKSASPSGTVAVGTPVAFTLQATRRGGVNPSNIEVTDTLPAGLTYVSHSAAAPWSCAFAAPTLTCTYPGTYTGQPFSNLPAITLNAMVGLGANNNVGTVTLPAGQTDPVSGNNSSSTVTVTGSNDADLSISKAPSIAPVLPGQTYNWVITARNNGPVSVAAGQTMTVTEVIPAGMQLNALPTGSGWVCNSSGGASFPQAGGVTVTCTRSGQLASGSTSSITVPVQHTGTGSLTNNVCVALTGTGPADPNGGNNCANVNNTSTGTSADLSITKLASGTVVVGQPLTYRLTVNNAGPDAATNVTVTDALSNLLSSAGAPGLASISPSQGSCTPSAPANVGSATVSCNLGSLASSGSATVDITVRPDNTGSTILSRGNMASVTSPDVGDPDRNNNSVTISSDVTPLVDLTVAKTVTPNPVKVGEPLVYVVTARNNGPSQASNVKITDVLPANTAMLGTATATNGGTCTAPADGATSGTIECTWPTIPRNTQYTATFRLRPLKAALGTTIHNVVNVTNDVPETDLSNNSNFADATVTAADLDILVHKTDSVDPVSLGGVTEYTITTTNVGPSIATNLVVTDTFPAAGSTPTARFSYQGDLTISIAGTSVPTADVTNYCTTVPAIGDLSGTLECNFPTIGVAAGNSIQIKYKMRAESITVAGAYAGTQRNHVEVKVDETEREASNNLVDEDTTTNRTAPPLGSTIDLGISKTTSTGQALPGTEFDYTLTVTNHQAAGSGRDVVPAHGAQVTDTLPAGLTFVSAPGCSYAAGPRQVVCVVPNLAAGASTAFTLRVRVDSPYTGAATISNTATVDMPGDPVSGNNSSTATKSAGSPPAAAIPTLSEWGLIILSMLLAALALHRVPKQSRRRM